MQIINAVWEQRNLGVSSYEIIIEQKDELQSVIQQFDQIEEKEYMVAKIPSICHWAIPFVQERGYNFIESAVTLVHHLKQIPVSSRIKAVFDKCGHFPMEKCDIDHMKDEIRKNIFKTDRICLDSSFETGFSAQRYIYWIEDMISSGLIPQKVCYDKETIGFFISKEIKPQVYDGILAAVYSDYEGTGLGACVQYMGLNYALCHKAKKYMGHVSANNLSVLKLLVSLGFEVADIHYIFVKHN